MEKTLPNERIRLVEHAHWADRTWTEYVYSQNEPETRPRELVGHILYAQRVWFERIEGEQKTQVFFPVLEKAALLKGFDEHRGIILDLIAKRLEDVIPFTRGTGEQYHARVADVIQHLLTHGYHHRGQLAAWYARKGAAYPNTDHINFLIVNKL